MSRVGAYLPIILIFGSLAVALISKELGLKPLVVGLTAGLAMSNVFHTIAHDFFKGVEELTVPVYALFFALAGAKVNPSLLGDVWIFVLLLVVIRAFGVWGGTTLGAKLSKVEQPAGRWIWTAMLPQAGISLALATLVNEQFSGFTFADKVFNILLSSIAINELIGPILFKLGLVRAGEDRSPRNS
ncbi:MAG: cation:proton antiporter, partial [Phycisphaerales bacterium]